MLLFFVLCVAPNQQSACVEFFSLVLFGRCPSQIFLVCTVLDSNLCKVMGLKSEVRHPPFSDYLSLALFIFLPARVLVYQSQEDFIRLVVEYGWLCIKRKKLWQHFGTFSPE